MEEGPLPMVTSTLMPTYSGGLLGELPLQEMAKTIEIAGITRVGWLVCCL